MQEVGDDAGLNIRLASCYTMTKNTRLLQAFFTTALLASGLAGCGGGGSDTPTTPSAPPPPQVEPGPVVSVSVATYSDIPKLTAFNRLNALRAEAGLGLFAQNARLDQAAQAHSNYQAANNAQGHNETPGLAGFTGVTPWNRAPAAGYQANALNEVINFDASLGGSGQVDALMSAPYHRIPLLSYSHLDVGFGYSVFPVGANTAALTINIGRTAGAMQGAPSTLLAVWPTDGTAGVSTTMTPEIPDPIPENNGASAGYAISAQVNEAWRTLAVSSFTLYDANGSVVSTKLLAAPADAFLSSFAGGGSYVALLPRAPLARNTTYTVTFTGFTTLQNNPQSQGPTPVSKTWSFTTGSR